MAKKDDLKKTEQAEEEELLANDEDVIQLVNDDGETINFYHVATLQHKDKWFVAFQPAEEFEDIDEDEIVFFELQSDGSGEDVFVPIEDDGLLDELFEQFEQMADADDDEEEVTGG